MKILLKNNIKFASGCGLFAGLIYRNLIMNPNVNIDIRENDFCQYLGPKKINCGFFDYYEYYVSWQTTPRPECYHYWNFEFDKINFITNDNTKKIKGRTFKGPIF